MDPWLTAADLARIFGVPRGTVYRWASEDRWRRTRTRPIRYRAADADTSFHKRRTDPAVSLDTQAEQQRSLVFVQSPHVSAAPVRALCHVRRRFVFGIASIVAFALALILWLASVHQGVFLTWQTFTIAGLLCLAVHEVTGWWPTRHGA